VTTPVEVVIDRGMCMGAGECVFTAGSLFQLDAEHKAVLIDVEAADDATILNAAASCPNFAISVLRDGRPVT
jgi:ferredoxin